MRIISGEFRGREIKSSDEVGLRPTTDRVRESMMSMIGHRAEFRFAKVLDLFAGTGALGLEAISRGAVSCDFIEQNKKCLKNIQKNILSLKIEVKCNLFGSDVLGFLAVNKKKYNIIFADPPYGSSVYAALAAETFIENALEENGIFVLEQPSYLTVLEFVGLETVLSRAFGETVVSIYSKKIFE